MRPPRPHQKRDDEYRGVTAETALEILARAHSSASGDQDVDLRNAIVREAARARVSPRQLAEDMMRVVSGPARRRTAGLLESLAAAAMLALALASCTPIDEAPLDDVATETEDGGDETEGWRDACYPGLCCEVCRPNSQGTWCIGCVPVTSAACEGDGNYLACGSDCAAPPELGTCQLGSWGNECCI